MEYSEESGELVLLPTALLHWYMSSAPLLMSMLEVKFSGFNPVENQHPNLTDIDYYVSLANVQSWKTLVGYTERVAGVGGGIMTGGFRCNS